MKTQLLCCLASLSMVASASAAVLVNEDFESYSTTAQMEAVWGPASGMGELVTTNGNPGNSAWHPGGAVNMWNASALSVSPSAANTVLLSADIFDSAVGSGQRNSVGLRNGANPLIEMGHYNSWASQYGVRLIGYGQNAWIQFPGVTRTAGWNHYEAILTDTSITFNLDLGADGTIDSTLTYNGAAPANPFVDLRFGGPSNLSSAAPAWFDNIRLEIIPVPEPSVFALGLLGAAALIARKRRQ